MKKKIIIIGIGSIGKRHLKNVLKLGFKDVFLVRRIKESPVEFPTIKVYTSIEEACSLHKIDYAFITTPTSNHFNDFLKLSKYNIPNIYIEKPITDAVEKAIQIELINKNLNLNVVVGYDLHFDLGLNKVKQLLSNNSIGNVCTFYAEVGQYLPDWRPNQDYSKSMSAKKNLGGGVMLDLIHEFDYLNWLLGPISKVFGKNKKSSNLKIETEDVSLNIIENKNGVAGVLVLDYLQKELSRKCKIIGDFGTIIWNYKNATVKWMTHLSENWEEYNYNHISRNDRFLEITKAFLNSSFSKRDSRLSSIEDSIISLKAVEKAKETNLLINLEQL